MSYELYEAIVDGELDDAEVLIASGEDIHFITSNDKWTYLHQAADTEDTPPKSIQFLIDKGLDVNAVDNYGYTPLMYAVRQRNVEVIRVLLKNGAEKLIEHQDNDGISALRLSFLNKPYSYDVVELMLEFGASPDSKNPNGKTVRDLLKVIADVDPEIHALIDKY